MSSTRRTACRWRRGGDVRCRELVGQPVNRRRGRGHDLADSLASGGLDHVVAPVDKHLERKSGLFGALGDSDRRLVKHEVDAVHQPR